MKAKTWVAAFAPPTVVLRLWFLVDLAQHQPLIGGPVLTAPHTLLALIAFPASVVVGTLIVWHRTDPTPPDSPATRQMSLCILFVVICFTLLSLLLELGDAVGDLTV